MITRDQLLGRILLLSKFIPKCRGKKDKHDPHAALFARPSSFHIPLGVVVRAVSLPPSSDGTAGVGNDAGTTAANRNLYIFSILQLWQLQAR